MKTKRLGSILCVWGISSAFANSARAEIKEALVGSQPIISSYNEINYTEVLGVIGALSLFVVFIVRHQKQIS